MKTKKVRIYKFIVLFFTILFTISFFIGFKNNTIDFKKIDNVNYYSSEATTILKDLFIDKKDFNRFHFQSLDDDEKNIYKGIERKLKTLKKSDIKPNSDLEFKVNDVTIGGSNDVKLKKIRRASNAYLNDTKELFFLDGSLIYSTNLSFKFTILSGYKKNNQLLFEDIDFFKTRIKFLTEQVKKLETTSLYSNQKYNNQDFLKIKFLHDYIILNNQYYPNYSHDYANNLRPFERELSHSPISALKNSLHPVCEGYAELFNCMLNILDIENIYVVGVAGENAQNVTNFEGNINVPNVERHAWNYVKIDGIFYLIDLTWDDPLVSGPGNHTYNISHTYFLTGPKQDHKPDNRYSYPFISTTNYIPITEVSLFNFKSYTETFKNDVKPFEGLNTTNFSLVIFKNGKVVSKSFDNIIMDQGVYIWYIVSKQSNNFYKNVIGSGLYEVDKKTFLKVNIPKNKDSSPFLDENGDFIALSALGDFSVNNDKTLKEIINKNNNEIYTLNGYKLTHCQLFDNLGNKIADISNNDFSTKPFSFYVKHTYYNKVILIPYYDKISISLFDKDENLLLNKQFMKDIYSYALKNPDKPGNLFSHFIKKDDNTIIMIKNKVFTQDLEVIAVYGKVQIFSNLVYQDKDDKLTVSNKIDKELLLNKDEYLIKKYDIVNIEKVSESADLIKLKFSLKEKTLEEILDIEIEIMVISLKYKTIHTKTQKEIPTNITTEITENIAKSFEYKFILPKNSIIYNVSLKGDNILVETRDIKVIENEIICVENGKIFFDRDNIIKLSKDDFNLADNIRVDKINILEKSDDGKSGRVELLLKAPGYDNLSSYIIDLNYKKIDAKTLAKTPIKTIIIIGASVFFGLIVLFSIVGVTIKKINEKNNKR